MLLRMTVNDRTNTFQGYTTMMLDFSESTWSIVQDPKQLWRLVGTRQQGSFEAKSWGEIHLRDPIYREKVLAIVQQAPRDDADFSHMNGLLQLCQASVSDFQGARCRWQLDVTTPAPVTPEKPLNKMRQRLVDLVKSKFAEKGKMYTHGPKSFNTVLANFTYERKSDSKKEGYTNCGAMATWVSTQLGRGTFLTIESLWKMMQTKAPGWVVATPKVLPRPGDVYILVKANGDFSHTGMVVSATSSSWETADTGQAPDGFSGGRHDRFYQASTNMIAGEATQGGDMRVVPGWLNINAKGLFKESDGID